MKIDSSPGGQVVDFLRSVDRLRGNVPDGVIRAHEAARAARLLAGSAPLRAKAVDAFGLVPTSGAELLRFAASPPRDQAQARILGAAMSFSYNLPEGLRGSGAAPRDLEALALHLDALAKDAASRNGPSLARREEGAAVEFLGGCLEAAVNGRKSQARRRLFAAASTLLVDLARRARARGDAALASRATDHVLRGLGKQRDLDLVAFYVRALQHAELPLDPAQRVLVERARAAALPAAAPVEAYTDGRKRPLEVRQMVHPEFWHEELAYYSKKNGWREVSRNAKDTRREYTRTIEDPSGERPPLRVHVVVKQGELDFLETMSDERVHVVIYSGHSALGGNLSQAVEASARMSGLPKTVLSMSCRGQDVYAEFDNKFPSALLITSKDPAYAVNADVMLASLYDTMARGESFAYMRRVSRPKMQFESKDNYVYPDEERRWHMHDADGDGRKDVHAGGADLHFDVDGRARGMAFTRAVSFVNTVLYYQGTDAEESGRKVPALSRLADHVLADGPMSESDAAKSGAPVRLVSETRRDAKGRSVQYYRVQYHPRLLRLERDVLAGVVTAHVVMQLTEKLHGELGDFERLRAALLGAQAIHYLDVYEDTAPRHMREYFRQMGLPPIEAEDIERLMTRYQAHASDPQTEAFARLAARLATVPRTA